MFGRECARILRARYCSTLLSSNHSWVPRDLSTAESWSYTEIFISNSRAFHAIEQPVESQVIPELKVPLDPFLLVAYAVLADKLQRMIVAELPKLASNAALFFNMLAKERRFQPSIYNFIRHNMSDNADTRYNISSLNFVLGTKLSVLLGDFLLSKIFEILASTENSEVQSILFKVVEHLVIGEAMDMTSSSEQLCSIANYLEMVYYKKASLLANSCKAIAILAGKDEEVTMMASNYGRYLGYANQLMDDMLDISGISATSGNLSSDIASVIHL